MALITELPIERSTIADDASILIERDGSMTVRILGVDFKESILIDISESVEHSFYDLVGDFRKSETKGQFYSFGKSLLESFGYNALDNRKDHGVPVLLEIDDTLDEEKGWLYHQTEAGKNYIKVAYSSGSTLSFKENDTVAMKVVVYSYAGILASAADWLKDFDFPGYPDQPTNMWNPSDSRNLVVERNAEKFMASLHDQIGTKALAEGNVGNRPQVFDLSPVNKVLLFEKNQSNLSTTAFTLANNAVWTIIIWVRASQRNEVLIESSSGNSQILLNYDTGSIDLVFSDSSKLSVQTSLFDKEFHMLSFVGNGTGTISVYQDKNLLGTVSSSQSLVDLDSIGAEGFSGLIGAFYIEQLIEASREEVQNLYSRMYTRYVLDEEWDEAMAYEFCTTLESSYTEDDISSYGFSEEDEYGFEL